MVFSSARLALASWTILERCEEHGITLNPEKVEFAKSDVKFCGYQLSPKGFAPDSSKMDAIASFPTNITDLWSFLGLVGQLSEFSPWIADSAEPLRDLLKPKNAWLWTTQHDVAFDKVKKALVSPRFLQIRLGSESCDQISASPNRPKRAKSRDKTAGSLFTRVYTLVEFS